MSSGSGGATVGRRTVVRGAGAGAAAVLLGRWRTARAASRVLTFNLDTSAIRDGFDGAQTWDTTGKKAAFQVSEALVWFDYRTNEVKPRLAQSWDVEEGNTAITFHLRPDVRFHDGSPLNADAVAFSLNRVYQAGNPYGADGKFTYKNWAPVDSAEAVDDLTVRVKLTNADPIVAWRFALEPTYICNPRGVMDLGNVDYSTTEKYTGTGPYRLARYSPGEVVILERNADYYGPPPSADRIIFKLNPDTNSKMADFLARQVDAITRPLVDRLDELRRTPGVRVQAFPTYVVSYATVNMAKPFLSDKRARQAVAMSFDREGFFKQVQPEAGTPSSLFWLQGGYALNEHPRVDVSFNPEGAKRLLEQAGWTQVGTDGVRRNGAGQRAETEINYSRAAGAAASPVAEFWQQGLKGIGIDAKLVTVEPAVATDPKAGWYNPERANVVLWGIASPVPDPSFVFERWLCKERAPAGFNMGQYCNPDMDALFDASGKELDLDARAGLFRQMQDLASEEIPWVPLDQANLIFAWWDDRVRNIWAGGPNVTFLREYDVSEG